MIEKRIEDAIRDVVDFPKPGIVFKDITPILEDAELMKDLISHWAEKLSGIEFDKIAAIESRGFLFGLPLAMAMGKAFVPIRKAGKLPWKTYKESYELEYGQAEIEVHQDAIASGDRILVLDDLIATGGTAEATMKLVERMGGEVAAFSFLLSLDFLPGRELLEKKGKEVCCILSYK